MTEQHRDDIDARTLAGHMHAGLPPTLRSVPIHRGEDRAVRLRSLIRYAIACSRVASMQPQEVSAVRDLAEWMVRHSDLLRHPGALAREWEPRWAWCVLDGIVVACSPVAATGDGSRYRSVVYSMCDGRWSATTAESCAELDVRAAIDRGRRGGWA